MAIGLVFGGGGAKGAYQAGVWWGLRRLGLEKEITAVSGTSVGGLNGALFALGDFFGCLKIWQSISEDDILCEETASQGLLSVVLGGDGFFCQGCLERIIGQNIEGDIKIDCFAACSDISRIPFVHILPAELYLNKRLELKPEYFNLKGLDKETCVKILLATCAIPFVYEGVTIGKKKYCDGGLCDNLPITPLYNEGYSDIIAVSLDFGEDKDEIRKKFPNAEIRLISPSRDLGNFITGTLNFSHDKLRELLRLGYVDCINMLSPRKP